MARRRTLVQHISDKRRWIQLALGVALWYAVSRNLVSLGVVILVGSAAGILLGKFFCRWMCPMGYVMETVMSTAPDGKAAAMYQYFKVGCPIAWAGGLLNRVSLLRVRENANPCASCGKCDEACYIAQFNEGWSLYKPDARNASAHYACSRCMACVTACPTGKLTLGTPLGDRKAPPVTAQK